MALTNTQLQTLKAAIAAETDATFSAYRDAGSTGLMAEWLNGVSATDVWRTDAPVAAVLDAVSWDKYTPTDAPDGSATFTNRLLAVQTKQMNLQNMLIGRERIDASRANIRAGLRDAVIALPTGAGGSLTTAGGVGGTTVLGACMRKATRAEKVFATTQATTGTSTAFLLGWEGSISDADVVLALSA